MESNHLQAMSADWRLNLATALDTQGGRDSTHYRDKLADPDYQAKAETAEAAMATEAADARQAARDSR